MMITSNSTVPQERSNQRQQVENTGLYIHIPFCVKKCRYCDFLSFPGYRGKERELQAYTDGLCRELSFYQTQQIPVDTVFIGGGTPSLLTERQTEQILKAVGDNFRLLPGAEISMESNPGTLTKEKLAVYREVGINRLSMGVQALDNRLLASLGRIHTGEEFLENYALARQAGFQNINLDLMFGLPGMGLYQWKSALQEILSLRPEHLSLYSLQLEEGTPFFEEYRNGRLKIPDEEEDREMYHQAIAAAKLSGYQHYEISNFSLPGYACRHNLKYWSYKPYIGVGLGAHSFSREKGRCSNVEDMNHYLEQIGRGSLPMAPGGNEMASEKEAMGEYIFTGLRKTEGIFLEDFFRVFKREFQEVYREKRQMISAWEREGLVQLKDGFFRLTEQGIDVSNGIMAEFV